MYTQLDEKTVDTHHRRVDVIRYLQRISRRVISSHFICLQLVGLHRVSAAYTLTQQISGFVNSRQEN